MSDKKVPDPGWNDPPTFSYDRATKIQASAEKKGVFLNKRIAFPLSGPGRPSLGGIDPTTPPMFADSNIGAPPLGSLPTTNQSVTPPVFTSSNGEVSLDDVIERLKAVHSIDQGDEISKRIQLMINMWEDGKFNTDVHRRLLELSQALQDGDIDTADRVQKSLMVDYVTLCSSWMVGVRQLIKKLRETNQEVASQDTEESEHGG